MIILIDTNVFLALVREQDPLGPQAISDGQKFSRDTFLTVPATLVEVCHMVTNRKGRLRFSELLTELRVQICTDVERDRIADVFSWLDQYAEHRPDWADACLVIASSFLPHSKIWTYDSEFITIWRRPDGSRIPLAVRRSSSPPKAVP
jgi:predicted nucleic acid-binding protein